MVHVLWVPLVPVLSDSAVFSNRTIAVADLHDGAIPNFAVG